MKNYDATTPKGFNTPKHAIGHNTFMMLMDDLSFTTPPSIKRLCAWLNISYKTMTRYISGTSPVPHAICYALFWESRWGRDSVYCDQKNSFDLMVTQMNVYKSKSRALESEVKRLSELVTGASNSPVYSIDDAAVKHLLPKPNSVTLRTPETRHDPVKHHFHDFKRRNLAHK